MINYLCASHRQNMERESPASRAGFWFEWMIEAAYQYELENWANAATYCGCALETCLIGLEKQDDDFELICNRLSLAAIYLFNIQHQRGQYNKARHCLATVCHIMGRLNINQQQRLIVQNVTELLQNADQHRAFFTHQLDMPFNGDPAINMNTSERSFHRPSMQLH